jgi:hypothetical protein
LIEIERTSTFAVSCGASPSPPQLAAPSVKAAMARQLETQAAPHMAIRFERPDM